MKSDFTKHIHQHVILADGALGSFLYEQGVEYGRNLDLLNLQAPELVQGAHEEYIRAGSQLIETNTFGANAFKLRAAGANSQVQKINRAGAEIAAKAAGSQAYVAGSVGPTGITFPLESAEITQDDIRNAFSEQMKGLVTGGIDLLILETFSHLEEILLAIDTASKVAPQLPIVAQMVFPSRGKSVEGIGALLCAEKMLKAGASVVGTNCGRGIDATVTAVNQMAEAGPDTLLSAFPNAGLPEVVDHRTIYPAQPGYMAMRAAEMIKRGVKLIGGCCGTTPDHIREFRQVLKVKPIRSETPLTVQKRPMEQTAYPDNSKNGSLLEGFSPAELPILVEIDPPSHLDAEHLTNGAQALAEAGVSAVSLGENPLAILRAGNLGLAYRIMELAGIPTIIHQTGRDINALGLQSRMLEAAILGIPAVLAVTGDSAVSTDQPGVSGVFDLDSMGLIRMLNRLNNGRSMADQDLRRQTDFSIGAAFSFRPANPDVQIRRLEKKAALGARFAMTQPLFSKEAVEQMMEKTSHLNMLIFPGIFPLISARNAEFLHHEVPGIVVPEVIRKKIGSYQQVSDQRQAAMEITEQLVEDISSFIDGLYLISPLNKWEVALKFVKQVRDAGFQGSGRHKSMIAP